MWMLKDLDEYVNVDVDLYVDIDVYVDVYVGYMWES